MEFLGGCLESILQFNSVPREIKLFKSVLAFFHSKSFWYFSCKKPFQEWKLHIIWIWKRLQDTIIEANRLVSKIPVISLLYPVYRGYRSTRWERMRKESVVVVVQVRSSLKVNIVFKSHFHIAEDVLGKKSFFQISVFENKKI